MQRINANQVERAISNREAFSAPSISAVWSDGQHMPTGQLADQALEMWQAAVRSGNVTYVVTSYDTPIAWIGKDGLVNWIMVKFSATTSKHQAICRRAL